MAARISKRHLYLIGVATLSALILVLRTVSLYTCFDTSLGYFERGSTIVLITRILLLLTLAGTLTLPLYLKREEAPLPHVTLDRAEQAVALPTALSFAACALFLLLRLSALAAPTVLCVLCVLALIAGAAYFVLLTMGKGEQAALCGYAVILSGILLLSVTYFDLYTPMNAPHKLSLHLCLLSVMLYMLYEVRALVGATAPRGSLISGAICFALSVPLCASNIIAFIGGAYRDPLYLAIDVLCLIFALYAAARTLCASLPQSVEEVSE